MEMASLSAEHQQLPAVLGGSLDEALLLNILKRIKAVIN